MEMKELAKKLGVENIIVSHYNDLTYKDHITVIVNKDLIINLVGSTYATVPLTAKGIDKTLEKNDLHKLLNAIKKELGE